MHAVTHFTFDNQDEYLAFCTHMSTFKSGQSVPKQSTATVVKEVEKPVRAEPVKAAEPKETVKAAPEKSTKPEAKTETPAPKKAAAAKAELNTEPTYENMKDAILAVANVFGTKAKAYEILSKYGHAKVTPDIPADDFAGIISDCREAINSRAA